MLDRLGPPLVGMLLLGLLAGCGSGSSDSSVTTPPAPTSTVTTGAPPVETESRAIPDFTVGVEQAYIMRVQTDGLDEPDLEGVLALAPQEEFITLHVISWRDLTEFGTATPLPFVRGYLYSDGSLLMQDDSGSYKFYGQMQADGRSMRGHWTLPTTFGEQNYHWDASCHPDSQICLD